MLKYCYENILFLPKYMNLDSESSYSYSTEDESARTSRFAKCIPKNAIKVKSFNNWKFEDLYFHNDTFYKYNGIDYSILPKHYDNQCHIYTTKTVDINNVIRVIYYTKFKRENGLIE